MRTTDGLTPAELAHYEQHGYVKLAAFADPGRCAGHARPRRRGHPRPGRGTRLSPGAGPAGLVLPEANLAGRPGRPEELASKVFTPPP